MAKEYVLPQAASEVERAIRMALTSVQSINGIKPDEKGNIIFPSASYEQIVQAVEEYLAKNKIGNTRIVEISLLSANWLGDESPYYQVVEIEGITMYSQVDLTPSVEQLAIFHDKDLAFVTENEDGVVTVYAIGDKPLNDYTMQATIKEVSV